MEAHTEDCRIIDLRQDNCWRMMILEDLSVSSQNTFRAIKELTVPDPELFEQIHERLAKKSPNIIKVIDVIKDKDKGTLKVELQTWQYTLKEYLAVHPKLELSTVCQLINDIIQGLKDMASLRLIYDISADIKPRSEHMEAMYGVVQQDRYRFKPLGYLISQLLKKTLNSSKSTTGSSCFDVVDRSGLTQESKNTINQMLNNQITIENIPTISCQSQNQNTKPNPQISDTRPQNQQRSTPPQTNSSPLPREQSTAREKPKPLQRSPLDTHDRTPQRSHQATPPRTTSSPSKCSEAKRRRRGRFPPTHDRSIQS